MRYVIFVIQTLSSILLKFEPTVVIHLAAISFVAHDDVNEIYDVNILGTRSLFSCLLKCGSKLDVVLVASSANVYGNSAAGVSESVPCMPENDYGAQNWPSNIYRDQLETLQLSSSGHLIIRCGANQSDF